MDETHLRAAFEKLAGPDGKITAKIGVTHLESATGLPRDELREVWRNSDRDGDGAWNWPEFCTAMADVRARLLARAPASPSSSPTVEPPAATTITAAIEALTLARSLVSTRAEYLRVLAETLRRERGALALRRNELDAELAHGHALWETLTTTSSSEGLKSPRTDRALIALDECEVSAGEFDLALVALRDSLERPETRTALTVIIGRLEEFRAKRIDAVSALSTSSPELVSSRRRSVGRRVDALGALAREMFTIANRSASS